MKQLILSTILIGLFTLCAQTSYACFCMKPEAREAFEHAGTVFVGQVVEIVEPRTTDPDAPLPGRYFVIRFKVERSWKGADFTSEINVLSAQGRYGCFAHPAVSKGERYLIYANVWNDWLLINDCSRTAVITGPIKPAALRTRVADPKSARDQLSFGPSQSGIDVDADLRLLESLQFPAFQFNYKLGKEPERRPFLNFMEPLVKQF